MGYDSNLKSQKSERHQRLVIVISILALTAAFFVVATLLQPAPANKNVASKSAIDSKMAAARAVAKAKEDAAKKLRASPQGKELGDGLAKSNEKKDELIVPSWLNETHISTTKP